jgi:hypothetical protein
MIFPPDSLYQLRNNLMARVERAELTEEAAALEALSADPADVRALEYLAFAAEQAGDLARAETYARDWILNNPSSCDAYLAMGRILLEETPRLSRALAYAQLGVAKAKFDEEAQERVQADWPVANFGQTNQEESEALVREMRPHRLIHELREHRLGLLDRETVAAILEDAANCQPLLMGILKEFGSGLLQDDDYSMVERALVLLGEIGDLAILPELTEFLTLEEEDLSGPADWAFRRISFRHPQETLVKMEEMLPHAGAPERVVLAQQIAMAAGGPGKGALLTKLMDGIDSYPKNEKEAVLFSVIAGFYVLEGGKSFQAAELESRYRDAFSKEGRSDLSLLRKETAEMGLGEATADELTVYDICCTQPADDEDDHAPVLATPRPQRNDPCWCGSGKKYKKCHLDSDSQS